MKDIGLKYKKRVLKTRSTFSIYPNPEEKYEEADIELDFFADEKPESGQIF
ncbi:MAG: hypothetical protein HC888_00250 [Candidatus Competibacteraceae bacterium]|nr:hypothetical protein [Candidatus Competibacteraceae bacterium]